MLLHLTSFLARNGQGRRFPRRVVPAQKVLLTFPASPLDMPPDASPLMRRAVLCCSRTERTE